jgi:plasmid stabilization system protein ParE
MSTHCALFASFLLLSCAEALPPANPAHDPQAARTLAQAKKEHERLHDELARAPANDRERCESEVDECLILVSERREHLATTRHVGSCNAMAEVEDKVACLDQELERLGKEREMAAYYEYDNACSRKVLECTEHLAEQAAVAAAAARAKQRHDELAVGFPEIAEGPLSVRERIDYLRSTLPPDAGVPCYSDEKKDPCFGAASEDEAQLDGELEKESYDRAKAAELYGRIARNETRCLEPQLACLTQALESYGLYQESKPWLERNLEAIDRRVKLALRIDRGARETCIKGPTAQHKDEVVAAYTAYAHEPVLFFRIRLEKAFLSLHEAQVGCLSGHAKEAKPAPVASSKK